MKKILALLIVGILICGNVYADVTRYKANASPVLVLLSNESASTLYQNIEFEYPTRHLIIQNNNSDRYVYVDVKSATNITDTSSCFLLGPDDKLSLDDFITDGITFIYASPDVVSASDVSVLSVF